MRDQIKKVLDLILRSIANGSRECAPDDRLRDASRRMELLKWKMLSRCSEYDDRQQTRLILSPQTWNKARRILVTDGVEISGRQTKLLQLSDLAKSEIG